MKNTLYDGYLGPRMTKAEAKRRISRVVAAELTDIVVLRYYDRLPLTEIAGKLGMSYGAVKLRHQKALSLLRASLA